MPINLQKLDEEIKFLETIREIAKDPERRKTLERFMSPNGNGTSTTNHVQGELPVHSTVQPPPPLRKYGLMREYALQVLDSTPRTVKQVIEAMKAKGWKPQAKDPGPSVTEVLVTLEKKGLVKKAAEQGPYGAFMWIK